MLRPLAVAARDLSWTEWIRQDHEAVLADLEELEQFWKGDRRTANDGRRARWVMWTLTSTVRRLRDQATRTLYWFGRVDPSGLFALTVDSLSMNDAYVSERMLAAAYGVAMSRQGADAEFLPVLRQFFEHLSAALVGASATAPSHHYLARLYVRGIVEFAKKFYESALPPALRGAWSFAVPAPVAPLAKGDVHHEEADQTLQMDFENYTLGGLFEDRSNYDSNHRGHQAAVSYVLGVVWSLGWRAETFGAIDRAIGQEGFRSEGRGRRAAAERYGKKYGWIGFFTYAGILEDRGQFPRRTWQFSDLDIDPSFPEPSVGDSGSDLSSEWLAPELQSHERWIREGTTSIPRSIIIREKIGDHQGPWIAVHGFIKAEDRVLGREAWGFVSAMLTARRSAPLLAASLKGGADLWMARDLPSDHYAFAGEIPWHPRFAAIALAEQAYRDSLRAGAEDVQVEGLAHSYAWESYHSEMNRAGGARVPSQRFARHFDLRGAAQTFDQFLHDGTRASITLTAVDGLEADIVYLRQDLLRQYAGERALVWIACGERGLRPYPPSPPDWLENARRSRADSWRLVLTETDLGLVGLRSALSDNGAVRRSPTKNARPSPAGKKTPKGVSAKQARPSGAGKRTPARGTTAARPSGAGKRTPAKGTSAKKAKPGAR